MTQHFVFESVPGYSPIHDDRERIKEPVAAGKSQRNERKVWTMKLNKEKFLKSELGGNLQECVTAWDHWLTELRKFNIDTVGQKYRETRKAADWCQAQWEVFQTVMRQFYNIEYHFSRTDEYFGVCTEDETDGQPGFTGYEFDLIEYDKDEYIKIQAEKNADLENEITQAQIAMCEIYEMMG